MTGDGELGEGERFLQLAKIFIAKRKKKLYHRFCGYGNYENIRLSLCPVICLPRFVGIIGFCFRHRPPKGPGRYDRNLFGIEN